MKMREQILPFKYRDPDPPNTCSRLARSLLSSFHAAFGCRRDARLKPLQKASAAGELRLPDRPGSMGTRKDIIFRQRSTLNPTRVRYAKRSIASQIGGSGSDVVRSPVARRGARTSPQLGGSSASTQGTTSGRWATPRMPVCGPARGLASMRVCADALVHPLYGCMGASFASGRPPRRP